MRKAVYFLVLGLFLIGCGFLLYYLFPKLTYNKISESPLPSFLSLDKNKEASTLDLWLPKLFSIFEGQDTGPELTAKEALLFDIDKEKVLYEKNAKEKAPMASLTKIMTAIVGLEHQKTNDEYQVAKEDLVGEDSMGLEEGESLSLEELLYGLVLHSGNDAAETIATNFPQGGRTAFIQAMNDKAASLGLTNTHFTNPTGLEGDGDQYTTAYDLLIITRYAMSHFPILDTIFQTFDYTIPVTSTHKAYYLENETNLLTSYPGVKGVKTGYTDEAGLCLITYLDYKGHHFIGVLLGSENRRDEMKDLLDLGLKEEGEKPPVHD